MLKLFHIPTNSIYIKDLDVNNFLKIVGIYGTLFMLSCLASFYILRKVHFKPRYMTSWIASWKPHQDPASFQKSLPWLTVLMTTVLLLPFPLLCVFAWRIYVEINDILGISVGLLTAACLLSLFGMGQWKSRKWRINRTIQGCFASALSIVCILQLKIVFLSHPARNIPLSIVFISINTIMVTYVTYALVQATLKPINFYYGLREAENINDAALSQNSCLCRKRNKPAKKMKNDDEEALLASKSDLDTIERPSTLALRVCVYIMSVLFLCAYAGLWHEVGEHFKFGAVIQVFAILTIDFTVFLCVFGDRFRSASQVFLYLALGRGVVLGFGHTYWFLGHCVMFGLLSTSFGFSLVNKSLPTFDTMEEKIKLFDEVDPLGASNLFKVGVFSKTKFGQWVFRNVEIIALVSLTGLFCCDMAVSYYRSSVPMHFFNGPHPQYLAGAITIALAIFAILSFLQFRMYTNNQHLVSGPVVLISFFAYCAGGGVGVFMWDQTGSVLILVICLFLPLIVYSSVHAYTLWKRNDYRFSVPGQPKSVWLIIDTVLVVLLAIAMGGALSFLIKPMWFGYTLTAGLLLLGFTTVGLIQWFNSLYMTVGALFNLVMAIVIYVSYLVTIYYLEMQGNNNGRVLYACGAFAYPISVMTLTTAYKFADDGFKVSRFLKYYMIIEGVLVLSFCGVLIAILPQPLIGAGLLTLLFVSAVLFTLPRLEQTKWVKLAYLCTILFVFSLAVYISVHDQGFWGFTVGVGVGWICLLELTLSKHSQHFSSFAEKLGLKKADVFSNLTELNSPDIFPVYTFVTTPGAHSPLKQNNSRILVVGGLLGVSMLWGLTAVYFVLPLAVGLGAIGISTVLMVYYAFETMTEPLVLFAAAVNAYGENSDAYLKALKQAKDTVARCQSYSKKCAATQEDNKSKPDVYSPLLSSELPEIDWQAVRDAKSQLEKQIPSTFGSSKVDTIIFKNPFPGEQLPTYTQFNDVGDDEEEYLIVDGVEDTQNSTLTIQQALQLLMFLDDLICTRYSRRSKFITHVQLEMIRASRVVVSEHTREIINCLNSMKDTKDQTLAQLSAPSLFQRAQAELREIQARKERLQQRNQQQRLAQIQAQHQRMAAREELIKASQPEIEAIAASGKKWTDPAFPPKPDSIIKNKRPTGKYAKWVTYPWYRAGDLSMSTQTEEAKEAKADVPVFKDIDPSVIQQGELGDCYVLSALSVLSQYPELLQKLIDVQHKAHGIYKVNFYHEGEPTCIFVDDWFPSKDGKVPAFARSADNSLWVMLLEKAYAKLYGSYEVIESGFVDQALIDMTGGSGSRIDMTKPDIKQKVRNGLLWEMLVDYYNQGYLMGAGSPSGSDARPAGREPISSFGIVQGHAYAVLHVVQIDQHRLIQLKNPWGKIEWKGDWSDSSPCWTNRLRKKIKQILKEKGKSLNNADVEDDGIFWMDFLDFTNHFEDVYVCRFFGPDRWIAQPLIVDEWKLGVSAGGCSNFRSVKTSPQFLLTVAHANTKIAISLSQQDSRGANQGLAAIAIEVYSNKGNLIRRGKTGELRATNPESYIYRREVLCETVLSPPGRGEGEGYTVLISTFDKDVERKFHLQVFSSKPVTFTRMVDE